MDERREYHRFLLHTQIKSLSIKDKTKIESTVKDISLGGVCITTSEQPLELNNTYIITFSLPNETQEINVHAIVMWSRKIDGLFDNGLMFTQISEEQLECIREYSIGSVNSE